MRGIWVAGSIALASCVAPSPADSRATDGETGSSTTNVGDGDGDGDGDGESETVGDGDTDADTDTDTDGEPACEPDEHPNAPECDTPTWIRTFGSTEDEETHGVTVGPNGEVYVVGITRGSLFMEFDGYASAFVMSLTPEGELAWGEQFGNSHITTARDVVVVPNEAIFVVGSAHEQLAEEPVPPGDKVFLARYEFDGTRSWIVQYTTELDDYFGTRIAAAPNGDVIVAGHMRGAATNGLDVFLARYSPAGEQLWLKHLDFWWKDLPYGLEVDPEGDIFVAGQGGPVPNNWNGDKSDAFVAKLHGDGEIAWTNHFGLEEHTEIGRGLVLEPEGGVRVIADVWGLVGEFCQVGRTDVGQYWFDEFGNLTHGRIDGTEETDDSFGAAQSSTGTVYVAGRTQGWLANDEPPTAVWSGFVLGYDENGSRVSVRQHGPLDYGHYTAIAIGPDDEIVTVGYGVGEEPTDSEVLVVKVGCE